MSEQAILPLNVTSEHDLSSLDKARVSHQRYIIKQQNEDLENAISYYIDAIRADASVAEPYYRLASLMFEKGQLSIESAIEQCKTAITLEPNNVNAHIYAGYFISLTEDYSAAQKEFDYAIKCSAINSARPRLFLSKILKKEMTITGATFPKMLKYLYYLFTGTVLLACDTSAIKMMIESFADNLSVFSYRTIGATLEKANIAKTLEK